MNLGKISGLLNIWVLAGAVTTACLLSAVMLLVFGLGRNRSAPDVSATAALNVIPADWSTPSSTGSQATPAEGEQTPPAPPSPNITIGSYVEVIGTGGTGLRLRSQPGLGGQVLLLASEAEVFKVDDGPVEQDGYLWWHLTGPFDPSRQGWAVANYLGVAQNP